MSPTPPRSIHTLTVDADPAGNQLLNIDFGGGNPIPTVGAPGLTFNAGGNGSSAGNHALNLFGTLPSGPFTTETDTANGTGTGTITLDGATLGYTGLQPIDDTVPAVNFTFNSDPGARIDPGHRWPDRERLLDDTRSSVRPRRPASSGSTSRTRVTSSSRLRRATIPWS